MIKPRIIPAIISPIIAGCFNLLIKNPKPLANIRATASNNNM